jgi:nitrile hydratase
VDGVHDLGGIQGFGPVEVEDHEPVFHADWERRAYRLTIATMMGGHLNGRFRYAIERMDPSWYLGSRYYEHWLTATATGLVEGGLVAQEELDERLGAPYPLSRPVRVPRLDDPGTSVDSHCFAVGDAVQVREWHPFGHTRAPRYVQGKTGVVVRLDGVFSLPDVEYHCDSIRLEPTYSVRFEAQDLWGTSGDPVHVDLWESYLEHRQVWVDG